MRLIVLTIGLLALTLMAGAGAQEIEKPIVGPTSIAPMVTPQIPLQPQLPADTTLPNIPTTTAVPSANVGAPPMASPTAEAHAPKCWCTQPNPAGGPLIKYKCAPECCGQAGAEGCH